MGEPQGRGLRGQDRGRGRRLRSLRALQARHEGAGQGRLVLHQPRAGARNARTRAGRRQDARGDQEARRGDVERPAGPHRRGGRHGRGDPHLLLVPVPRQPLLAQVLRARRRGQPLLLQSLRRQGARRVHVHRQRLLGHVPLAVPADEHPAPHHAGPLHAGAAGRAGAVRLAPLVVRSGRDGRHARQPLDFAADGRLGQGHPHVRPGQGPRSLRPRGDEQGPVGRRQRPRRMEGVLATGLRPLSRVDGFDGPDARIRLRRLLRLATGPHDRQQVLRGDLRPRHV